LGGCGGSRRIVFVIVKEVLTGGEGGRKTSSVHPEGVRSPAMVGGAAEC